MSKQGFNIYKRKDGRWEARYPKGRNENGKLRYQYYYGKTYKEVKQKLLEHKLSPVTERIHNHSIHEYAQDWLASMRPFVKESTYARYYQVVSTQILPYFHQMPVTSMTSFVLTAFYSELITRGRRDGKGGLSESSASEILRIVKSILLFAKTRDHLELPDPSLNISQRKPKAVQILSDSEQKQISQYLFQNQSSLNLGILLSMYTGLRIGEICAMTWGEVDLTNRIISVRKTLQRVRNWGESTSQEKGRRKTSIILSSPKSENSVRIIPIPAFLSPILATQQQDSSAYVLTGTTKYMEPRTLQYHFKKIEQELGLTGIHFHCLRHSFATRCVELGFDTKTLSEILGHANISTTLSLYVHSSLDQKRKNMDRLRPGFGPSE